MFNRIIVFIVVILSVYTINADGNRIISNEDNIVKAVSSALNSIGVNYDYNKKGYKITHLGSSNKSQVQDNKILFDCEIASCILESDSLNIISIALKNNIQRERSSTDNKSLINKAISISNIFLCCKKTTVSNFICEESDESLVSDDGYGAFVVNADVKYNSYDYSGCFTVIFDKKGNLTDVNIPIIFYISVKNKINISSEDAINIAIKDASIKYNNKYATSNLFLENSKIAFFTSG